MILASQFAMGVNAVLMDVVVFAGSVLSLEHSVLMGFAETFHVLPIVKVKTAVMMDVADRVVRVGME